MTLLNQIPQTNEIDMRYNKVTESNLRYGIIEVTTSCQLLCPGCYMVRRENLNKGQLSLEDSIKILDLCKEYRGGEELETMDILGGEPLLWPFLKDFINELLKRNIKPWIFTNMLSINPELASWLFERKVHITGKLNIADPENIEQIKVQAKMIGRNTKISKKMFEAIKVFQNAGYKDPLFRLQNLIRKDNLYLIPDYIFFCRSEKIGVDLELMGSGEPINKEYFKIAPTPEELAELVRTLDKKGQEYKKTMEINDENFPEFNNPVDKILMPHLFGSCPFYDKGLYFAMNGEIRACSNSTITLSNINNPNPIKTAYESQLICNRKTLSRSNIGDPCNKCDRWKQCRGGCRATAEGTGNPFKGYELCPLPILQNTSE